MTFEPIAVSVSIVTIAASSDAKIIVELKETSDMVRRALAFILSFLTARQIFPESREILGRYGQDIWTASSSVREAQGYANT